MRKRVGSERNFNVFLVLVVTISFALFFLESFPMTGNITSGSTTSNVSISTYYSTSLGTNLYEGINFGAVAVLPATNVNATHNNDSSTYSLGTNYTIDVSADSNSAVDFCVKANEGLTSPALDVIGLGNETYYASNLTNSTHPSLSNEISMTTGYVKAINSIGRGNSSYWRFWLDVPSAQASGSYNNSVSFEGVQAGQGC
ncbi:hypothetical protein AUJ61_00545 [Candidatus Pacearchaeota archaeon CG1_02_30_18]|nr:MAG: hypothetical protein AUJ61_00545 [Candidatus Pacearchaeota archaeon CG1_02_30_18]PIN71703.1 MAG: hypothetical protein COV77_00345 [Candidatus Pacearchaeota archaeon CG11_big_fil_rev_8_21_14_0_20_30_13]PJA71153.1 MAG: hypothetical protein CO153_02995 [Candidatus Pacearchaeota archaeon CG_4_9_14_3_um_filter_30_11]